MMSGRSYMKYDHPLQEDPRFTEDDESCPCCDELFKELKAEREKNKEFQRRIETIRSDREEARAKTSLRHIGLDLAVQIMEGAIIEGEGEDD